VSVAAATYRVLHETHYRYEVPVLLAQHLLRLTPRRCAWQSCEAHRVDIEPAAAERRAHTDYFGNRVVQIALEAPHEELRVIADSIVSVATHLPRIAPEDTQPWEAAREALRSADTAAALDAYQYAFASPGVQLTPGLADFAAASFTPQRPVLEALLDLTRTIHEDFEFDSEATSVSTPVAEVLAHRRGVCQDFAHLQIAALRSIGLAARYVSGYLLTRPPPGKPRLIGADASHAWVSLYLPEYGWVDVDPTNDLLPDVQHITLAWGRDFSDVSPLRGVILGGGEHELEVRVSVLPLDAERDLPETPT
jgi:transglutaminase-like putative cysteine protease